MRMETGGVQGGKKEGKRNNIPSQDIKCEKEINGQISYPSSSSSFFLSSSSTSSSSFSTSSFVSSVVGSGSDSDRSQSISPIPPSLEHDLTVQTASRTTGVSHIVGQRIGMKYTPLPHASPPGTSLVPNSSTHLVPSVSTSELFKSANNDTLLRPPLMSEDRLSSELGSDILSHPLSYLPGSDVSRPCPSPPLLSPDFHPEDPDFSSFSSMWAQGEESNNNIWDEKDIMHSEISALHTPFSTSILDEPLYCTDITPIEKKKTKVTERKKAASGMTTDSSIPTSSFSTSSVALPVSGQSISQTECKNKIKMEDTSSISTSNSLISAAASISYPPSACLSVPPISNNRRRPSNEQILNLTQGPIKGPILADSSDEEAGTSGQGSGQDFLSLRKRRKLNSIVPNPRKPRTADYMCANCSEVREETRTFSPMQTNTNGEVSRYASIELSPSLCLYPSFPLSLSLRLFPSVSFTLSLSLCLSPTLQLYLSLGLSVTTSFTLDDSQHRFHFVTIPFLSHHSSLSYPFSHYPLLSSLAC